MKIRFERMFLRSNGFPVRIEPDGNCTRPGQRRRRRDGVRAAAPVMLRPPAGLESVAASATLLIAPMDALMTGSEMPLDRSNGRSDAGLDRARLAADNRHQAEKECASIPHREHATRKRKLSKKRLSDGIGSQSKPEVWAICCCNGVLNKIFMRDFLTSPGTRFWRPGFGRQSGSHIAKPWLSSHQAMRREESRPSGKSKTPRR